MAESKTPKHDFAPAWLKLPSQENKSPKPQNTNYHSLSLNENKSPRSNKHDNNGNGEFKRPFRHRRDSGGIRTHDRYDTLQRQHSFDNYPETGRYSGKQRHSSVEDYYSYQYNGYSSYNGYNDSTYMSQQSHQRNAKYNPNNSRYNKQLMSMYGPSYYDMYPYEFYAGEPYYGYSSSRHKRGNHEKDTRVNQRDAKPTDKDHTLEPNFNEEFPSLNGQDGDKNINNKVFSGSGVWVNPPQKKLIPEPPQSTDLPKESPTKINSSYRVLMSSKNVLPKKSSLRINGTHTNQDPSLINKSTKLQNGTGGSPTPPIDILNTRLQTHTRIKGDKTEFLKTLRNPSSCNGTESPRDHSKTGLTSSNEDLVNGVEHLKVDTEEQRLSSSVEAEQRLLREMGWSEQDDGEEYVITEAEMREFQNLTQQVKQQPANGLTRTIPKSWSSPNHSVFTAAPLTDLKDELSSSDSDSDDSC